MTKSKLNSLSKALLGANLALGIALAPALAFADGTLQLKPLQNTNVYNNGSYDTGAYNNSGYNTGYNNNTTTGYGSNTGYGNDYYNAYGNNTYGNNTTLQGRLVSIPKGTLMTVNLNHPINSGSAHVGDPVNGTIENDVFVNDSVAIPAGSQVLGQVASVDSAAHLGKDGRIDVRFDSIKLADGRVVPISAHIVTKDETGVLKGDTYAMDIAKGVGIAAAGTGIGTLMGTAAGSLLGSVGTGAVFGLGVGALGGMGYALARKGKDVEVPSGARMSLKIDTPVTMNN